MPLTSGNDVPGTRALSEHIIPQPARPKSWQSSESWFQLGRNVRKDLDRNPTGERGGFVMTLVPNQQSQF